MIRLLWVVALAVTAGCALQPQVLPITPQLDLGSAQSRGAGRSIAIDAIDGRPDNIVGYRDPADSNSVITTSGETMRAIQRALEDGYGRLGFTVVAQGESADITLEVRLTELGYERQGGKFVKNIRTGATLEATSIMRSQTVNGTYRDSQGKETVMKQTLEDNALVMNKHLGAALSRLIADQRLTRE